MMRFHLAAVAASLLLGLPAWAASEVLVEGGGVTVTRDDVQADMLRLPEETRAAMLARPDSLRGIATNLYQRRVLALEAEKSGATTQPLAAAQLQIARDRVLSDLRLVELDRAATPSEAALDAQAQSTYRAEPQRFAHPEQIEARHILILTATPDARAKAEQLLAELRAGAKFEDLARANSADSGSAARGGDLGWFARGRMVPEFETVAFALQKPGDLSGVVETKFGFHIIQLQGKRAAGTKPFAEVRDELRKEVGTGALRVAREKEVQRLMGLAKFNDAGFDALAKTKP
jgi:peptidyl-prolyl cis-trans isomerase C